MAEVRMITSVIQQIGRQKIAMLGSVKAAKLEGEVYDVRDNGVVSYFFADTDTLPLGANKVECNTGDGKITVLSFNLQKEPVQLNYDVLNTPINGYKTSTEINNDTLQMPFDEVQNKFDALVDQLRRQGIIL